MQWRTDRNLEPLDKEAPRQQTKTLHRGKRAFGEYGGERTAHQKLRSLDWGANEKKRHTRSPVLKHARSEKKRKGFTNVNEIAGQKNSKRES